jgi:hypothetical protein
VCFLPARMLTSNTPVAVISSRKKAERGTQWYRRGIFLFMAYLTALYLLSLLYFFGSLRKYPEQPRLQKSLYNSSTRRTPSAPKSGRNFGMLSAVA